MRPSAHILALPALALLALGAVGCGSDAKDTTATNAAPAAATTTTTAGTTATTTAGTTAPTSAESTATSTGETAAAFDAVAYCAAEAAVESAGAQLQGPDEDPTVAGTAFLPFVQTVHDLAPPELTPVFDEALAAVHTMIESGSSDALESLDLHVAHEYDVAHCGWTSTAVKTQDYKFVDLPESLTAGTYNFEVTNEGTEPHVMIIVKKKAGVTKSYDELLADPAAESMVDTVAAAFNPPGGNSHAVATLEPGEYLALCPISKGTTMTSEGTGEPHFMLGMHQVITVTA